jgi:hypothetical protein
MDSGAEVTTHGEGVVLYLDGEPDVSGLRYDPVLDGDYHLDRWHLVESKVTSVRYHLLRSSDRSDMHDHPWDYVTTLLSGAYVEHTPLGATWYQAPCTLVRPAEWVHRLELAESPCWTLMMTGPMRRAWGFHTSEGFVPWRSYSSTPSHSREW